MVRIVHNVITQLRHQIRTGGIILRDITMRREWNTHTPTGHRRTNCVSSSQTLGSGPCAKMFVVKII